MKNFVKLTAATLLTTLSLGANATAGDRSHEISLKWSDTMSAAQNYDAAEIAINKYCRIEASRSNERSLSFKKRFIENCEVQLMDGFVGQVDKAELTAHYAGIKNPVTNIREFAAK